MKASCGAFVKCLQVLNLMENFGMGIDAAQKRDDDAASDSCSGTLPPARSSAGRSPSLGCCCRWKRWGNRAAQNQEGGQVGARSQVVVLVTQLLYNKTIIVHGKKNSSVDFYVIVNFELYCLV
jgi:hypothetical protein